MWLRLVGLSQTRTGTFPLEVHPGCSEVNGMSKSTVLWRFVTKSYRGGARPCDPRHSSGLARALRFAFVGSLGAGWLTWTPATAHACLARVARRVTREWVPLSTTRWHAATSEGEPRTARAPPQRSSGRIPRGRRLSDPSRTAALSSIKLGGSGHYE